MDKSLLTYKRKSHIEIGEIYFWTATINKWQHLLGRDEFKDVVISSLEYLSNKGKIDVFAFIIMPNHVHIIWRINETNGKENTQASFLKYTAHEFKKLLQDEHSGELHHYTVNAHNKKYEFWQRDSLAIKLFTRDVAYQKLNYLHNNPMAEHWQLAKDPCDYKYSTARFYEMGTSDYSFTKDLRNEF